MLLASTITDFQAGAAAICRHRYGTIEVVSGRLTAVYLRRWPKLISLGEVWLQAQFFRSARDADRCLLYYDQPLGSPNFLALKYLVSSRRATFGTVRVAAAVLDEIARLKQTDAIVCEAWNLRLSPRLLTRFGWERHLPQSRRRHYIKRFYGQFPARAGLEPIFSEGPSPSPGARLADWQEAENPGQDAGQPSPETVCQ